MPRKVTPGLMEAVNEFLEVRSTWVAPSTQINDRSLLTRFAREVGATRQVHTVDARCLEKWFAEKAKTQRPSSYNKIRNRISTFIKFCTLRGWLNSDPLGMVRPQRVVKREWLRLSPAELIALPRYAATERDKVLISILTNTACRASEVTSLRIKDVDLANSRMRVYVSKSALEDWLPITRELDVALRDWLMAYQDEMEGEPLDPEWFLVPQRLPGHGWMQTKKGIRGAVWDHHVYGPLLPDKRIMKPAKIVQRVLTASGAPVAPGEGCHTIRRSVARAYFDCRVSGGYDGALRETSALLHHANSTITEEYLGLKTERLGRDAALAGKPFLTAMVAVDNVVDIRLAPPLA